MDVVSIDIGIKNFAVCGVTNNKVVYWTTFALAGKTWYDKCRGLYERLEKDGFFMAKECRIEKQYSRNVKARLLQQHIITCWLVKTGKQPLIISPFRRGGTYSQRKRAAITEAKQNFTNHMCSKMLMVWENARKRDDLADAFLQAIRVMGNQ